jgi:hypothetical protein
MGWNLEYGAEHLSFVCFGYTIRRSKGSAISVQMGQPPLFLAEQQHHHHDLPEYFDSARSGSLRLE